MDTHENDTPTAGAIYVETPEIGLPELPRPTAPLEPRAIPGLVAPQVQKPDGSSRSTSDWAALLAYRTPLQEHSLACDGKAAAVLTTLGIMFTIVAHYSEVIGQSLQRDPILGKILVTLIGAFGLFGVASVVQSFRTIIPRFPPAPRSLAFFGDILRLTRLEYIAQVEAMSDDEALEHILNFNHTLSLIVVDKLAHLGRCLRLFEFASVAWLGAVVVLTFRAVRTVIHG